MTRTSYNIQKKPTKSKQIILYWENELWMNSIAALFMAKDSFLLEIFISLGSSAKMSLIHKVIFYIDEYWHQRRMSF